MRDIAFSGRVDMICTCLGTAVSISSTTSMLDADVQKEGAIPWPFGSDARPLLWLGSRLAILAVVLLLFPRVDLIELDESQKANTQSDGDWIPLNLAGWLGAFWRLLREETPGREMERRWLCPPRGKVCSSGDTWRVSTCGCAREAESPRYWAQHEGGHVGSGGGAPAMPSAKQIADFAVGGSQTRLWLRCDPQRRWDSRYRLRGEVVSQKDARSCCGCCGRRNDVDEDSVL